MPFDVLIVGGGPAGLAAAIRIKQLCQETGKDLSVCLIDKGRYVLFEIMDKKKKERILRSSASELHETRNTSEQGESISSHSALILLVLASFHNNSLLCLSILFSEIGSHILSGNVFDPKALHELFPELADDDAWTKELLEAVGSHATPVADDQFLVLTESGGSYTIPNLLLPPQLDNHGNYIISLGNLCRWLGEQAMELGAEVFPGFAAALGKEEQQDH